MAKPSTCPDPSRLRDLLNGQVAEAEQAELTSHLEACEHCQRMVDELAAGRDSWSDARQLSECRPAPDAALGRVMQQLKGQANQRTHGEAASENDIPLDFLSPTDSPEYLGRLGPYQVMEVIGRGGMGIVLKARDPSLQRIVAIKVLASHLAMTATARRRFKREAQAAAAVSHDHIVTIHAVDEANGFPYLVMQYIAGMSLQECIDRSGPLRLKEILRVGMQTASGLAAAHAQGLIHRDIKPANILLENGVQRVKITDFGLARATDDVAALTQSGVIAGTPQYMAPEQARGEELDTRADLFSLGSVLYAMCTGRPPFGESSALAVLRRVTDEEPRPISQINPEIPAWLVDIVAKLHAKNPADRFQSASEVADVLSQRLAEVQQAGWTPPPVRPTERLAEPAAKTIKPLTSVTICPLCACHLHIPDRMVGQIVNCPECGKPFHVEDGTEEIEVLRGLQVQGPRPNPPKRKSRAWVLLLILLLALPVLLLACAVPFFAFSWLMFRGESGPNGIHAELSGPVVMDRAPRAMHGPLGPEAADLARVECVWQATQIVQEGENAGEEMLAQTTWELADGDFTLRLKTGMQRGHYMLDTGVNPKWINLDVTDGPDKGGEYLGIFKWEEDKLIVCLAPVAFVGGEVRLRPQDFSAPPGSGRTMYVLRQKKN